MNQKVKQHTDRSELLKLLPLVQFFRYPSEQENRLHESLLKVMLSLQNVIIFLNHVKLNFIVRPEVDHSGLMSPALSAQQVFFESECERLQQR